MKSLVVAEKPSAGRDMAEVLGCRIKKDGYMEGENYIVTWAAGHLVGLKYPEEHEERFKFWKLEDLPFFFDISSSLKVLPGAGKQFQIIKSLIHRADVGMIINAGDAGREGLLIQNWIYRMAGNKKPVKVLWADSLTTETLRRAFGNLHENDAFYNLMQEAEARAEGDNALGINYSRALTLTKAQRGTVLRYGRCQTPLTNLIYLRELEIENFIKKDYYTLSARFGTSGSEFVGILTDDSGQSMKMNSMQEARGMIADMKGKAATVHSYQEERKQKKAPRLFNLISLQKTMASSYGFSPDKTLELAQSLYEKKILSYPRTDSRFISEDVYREMGRHIQSLCFGKFAEMMGKVNMNQILSVKLYVNDKKVTDHHALLPTIHPGMENVYNQLSEDEKKVFDAVAVSVIALYYPEYQYNSIAAMIHIGPYLFKCTGMTVKNKGWKAVYQYSESEQEENAGEMLPPLKEGMQLSVMEIEEKKQQTKPKPRYTYNSLLQVMEKYHIGTSATTADIILKIQGIKDKSRKVDAKSAYVMIDGKGKFAITQLGREYMKVVPEELKDPFLTQRFEEELEKIGSGRMSKEQFLSKLQKEICENIKRFAENTGGRVSQNLGVCPACGKGKLYLGKKKVFCSEYKAGCVFSIWRVVARKELTENNIMQLITQGRTSVISGFVKSDGTVFSSALMMKPDYSGVCFPARKRKKRK